MTFIEFPPGESYNHPATLNVADISGFQKRQEGGTFIWGRVQFVTSMDYADVQDLIIKAGATVLSPEEGVALTWE